MIGYICGCCYYIEERGEQILWLFWSTGSELAFKDVEFSGVVEVSAFGSVITSGVVEVSSVGALGSVITSGVVVLYLCSTKWARFLGFLMDHAHEKSTPIY